MKTLKTAWSKPISSPMEIPPPGDGVSPGVACASEDAHRGGGKNFAPRTSWESSEHYEGTLFAVHPDLRVAVCPDRLQFLIQRRRGTRHGQARFETLSYPTDLIGLRQLLHTRYRVPLNVAMELTARLPRVARLIEKPTEQ